MMMYPPSVPLRKDMLRCYDSFVPWLHIASDKMLSAGLGMMLSPIWVLDSVISIPAA